MKYAITGHTRGIGKFIFDTLDSCVGFSKSTGYDITIKADRKRIIKELSDVDIFINNASDSYGQTAMLYDLWYEWKDTNKTIINVGSRIAEDTVVLGLEHQHLLNYRNQKLSLKNLYTDLSKIQTQVTVKYTWFAYVGTDEILKKYPHFTVNDYISVEQAAMQILNS